jgi:membrane carboxypeptidase/penicillin-binding protein
LNTFLYGLSLVLGGAEVSLLQLTASYLPFGQGGQYKKPIAIPDLILIDPNRNEIINVEAKQYSTRKKGVEELNGYDEIENLYIKKHYPRYKVIRTVVLYGDTGDKLDDVHISFLLNKDGKLVLATNAPLLMQEAIQYLKDYWKDN